PSVPGPMRTSFNIAALTGFVGWTALGLFLALLPSMAQSVLPKSGTLSEAVIVGSVLAVAAAGQRAAPELRRRAAQTLRLTLMGLGAALLLTSTLPSIGPHAVTALLVIAAVTAGTGHGLGYWAASRAIALPTPAKKRAESSAA